MYLVTRTGLGTYCLLMRHRHVGPLTFKDKLLRESTRIQKLDVEATSRQQHQEKDNSSARHLR